MSPPPSLLNHLNIISEMPNAIIQMCNQANLTKNCLKLLILTGSKVHALFNSPHNYTVICNVK